MKTLDEVITDMSPEARARVEGRFRELIAEEAGATPGPDDLSRGLGSLTVDAYYNVNGVKTRYLGAVTDRPEVAFSNDLGVYCRSYRGASIFDHGGDQLVFPLQEWVEPSHRWETFSRLEERRVYSQEGDEATAMTCLFVGRHFALFSRPDGHEVCIQHDSPVATSKLRVRVEAPPPKVAYVNLYSDGYATSHPDVTSSDYLADVRRAVDRTRVARKRVEYRPGDLDD